MDKLNMSKCLFILLTVSLIHTESYSEPDITITNNQQFQSEQAHLLKLLNEIPKELGITDTVHLEAIEGYIQNAEQGYDSEIVVNFAETIRIAAASLAAYVKGAEAIQSLTDDFENSLSSKQQQKLLILMAELYNWAQRYQIAFDLVDEILPQIDDPYLRGLAYSTIGYAVFRLGRYEVAIEYYINAIAFFSEDDQTSRIAEVYNRLGQVYYSLNDYGVSIRYFQKHIDMAAQEGDEIALATGYLNIGASYRQSGDLDRALESILAGIELREQLGNIVEIARGKMNLANLYASMERFDEALQSYQESLAISEEHGIENGILMNHKNIGSLHFLANRLDESEAAYMAAFHLMNRESHIFELRHVSKQLAELYETKGDYLQAFNYLQLFTELNGEIFDSERLEILEDLRTRYETELKEQDLAIAELTIGTQIMQTRILIVLLLSLIITSGIGFIYFRKRNEYYQGLYNRNLEVLELLGIDSDSVRKAQHSVDDKEEASDQMDELYQIIKPLFTEKKIYRDPDLKLSTIAKLVGSNTKYISEAIKSSSNMQFNHYVNFYRVNEAKKMILNGEKSMSEVQHACGFNSRTTFYTAFKTFTGMSPSKFKEMSRYRVSE